MFRPLLRFQSLAGLRLATGFLLTTNALLAQGAQTPAASRAQAAPQAQAQAQAAPQAQPQAPPNIVFIMADDLGWGEIGAFGQELIPTPHLDRLAAEGMRLTAHYSGNPVCAPSRCVLLTGLHGGHAIVRNNWENGSWGETQPEGQYPLPKGTPTISLALQQAGYRTCAVGKWGLGGPVTSGAPQLQGFDHFFGYLCQRKAHNYYPVHLWRNDSRVFLEGNRWFRAHQKLAAPLESEGAYAELFEAGTYAPDAMLSEALGWLETHGKEPFFLYYPSPIPHVALQVPSVHLADMPKEWDAEPYLGQRNYLPHPRPRAAYAAMVAHLDSEVGALMAKLEELGVADNTLVVFTSDNGPTYNGGTDSAFFRSAGPFRGLKGSMYEGGIRVPTLVRWPGRVAPGSSSDQVSGFQDWFPTLAQATSTEHPLGLDGVSLLPTLLGEGTQAQHEVLYWELGNKAALREGDWKLVWLGLKGESPRAELYNLAQDPGETQDLAATEPERLARMMDLVLTHREPSPIFPQPWLDQ